ncbi:uroporphyrinogen-III C-methyltransferase [Salmonella enterica subsp. enterica serovar Berta]|nr:uroporphyrinogen-III C-methyltransferase [Salmonella enterica subsp. enterica serovar Berta]
MTEQEKSSAVVDETRESVETTPQPVNTEKKSKNGAALVLSAVAIAIALAAGIGLYGWGKQQATAQTETSDALAAGIGLYGWGKQQATAQTETSDALATQLTALQKAQESQKAELEGIIKKQAAQLDDANRQQAALAKQLDEVQQKVATISGSDAKTWLLAQADFLVKLAGRKLWSDQDVTTAAALLKSADASLADMNDPSLITARRAITDDIASLSSVAQIDYDGIILKLNQLSNQIDNLRLADNDTDGSPMDSDSSELSSSLSEWRVNLQKSWQNFMDSFITIRRRDDTAVPLLAPNQDVYLRENIRSRLLVAAQAVPRHQEETYRQALDNVSTWVRAYYDTDDAATKAFLEEVDKLSQQNITMDLPETLGSQAILEKLMQTRVRNLLAQPTVSTAAPATQTDAPAAAPQGE